MSHLPNLVNTPPGGWRYLVPETGKTIGPFSGKKQLIDLLAGHYLSAGYVMPKDIFQKVEAQICGNYPEYCDEPPRGFVERFVDGVKSLYHTFHAAKQCMVTLAAHLAGSGERPSQELREARARTCATSGPDGALCPMNQPITPCSTCQMSSLTSLINKLAGAVKTQYDGQLQFCAVCHCNLRAKIAIKHEAIWNHMPQSQKERLPENCWLVTEAK